MTFEEIAQRLEPEAAATVSGIPDIGGAVQISIAISLKRMADFICGSPSNCDVVDYLSGRIGGGQ